MTEMLAIKVTLCGSRRDNGKRIRYGARRCNSSNKTFSFKRSKHEKKIKRREVWRRKPTMMGYLLQNQSINVTSHITDNDLHVVYKRETKSSSKSNDYPQTVVNACVKTQN